MVIQVLKPSSWPTEPYTKIHKHGLNHSIMTYHGIMS